MEEIVPRSSSAANESRLAEVVGGARDCPSIRPLFSGVLKGSPFMSRTTSKYLYCLDMRRRANDN